MWALVFVTGMITVVLFLLRRSGTHIFSKWIRVGEALGFLTDLNWVYHSQLDKMDFELDSKRVVDIIYTS